MIVITMNPKPAGGFDVHHQKRTGTIPALIATFTNGPLQRRLVAQLAVQLGQETLDEDMEVQAGEYSREIADHIRAAHVRLVFAKKG